jgi:hypothetical protein
VAVLSTVREAEEAAGHLWQQQQLDRPWWVRLNEFEAGRTGAPYVDVSATPEMRRLGGISVMNVLAMVVASHAHHLVVVGHRAGTAARRRTVTDASDSVAWRAWSRNRMPGRQQALHRAALKYGHSYLVVDPSSTGATPRLHTRTPLTMVASYLDTEADEWPQLALEFSIREESTTRHVVRGLLWDDLMVWPVELGAYDPRLISGDRYLLRSQTALATAPRVDGPPVMHAVGHPPVVRYIKTWDTDAAVRYWLGEIEPLIGPQLALNEVNFDRHVVSRFGAFPQRLIIGWKDATDADRMRASMARVWAVGADPDKVKATQFPAAQVNGHNELIERLQEYVAMVGMVPPTMVTGKMINMTAEAMAVAMFGQQLKALDHRDSLGASHAQALRLMARLDGDQETAVDEEISPVWRPTEARSYAAAVDGASKLNAAGMPLEELLQDIPGWTQERIDAARDLIRDPTSIPPTTRQETPA